MTPGHLHLVIKNLHFSHLLFALGHRVKTPEHADQSSLVNVGGQSNHALQLLL